MDTIATPAADAPATTPRFGLDDIADIWEAPAFQKAEPDRRARMLDTVLADGFQELVSAPDYSPATYRAYTALAQKAHARLEKQKSTWEATKETAGKVTGFVTGLAKDAGTAVMAVANEFNPFADRIDNDPTGTTPVMEGMAAGAALGTRQRFDTLDAKLSELSGVTKPAEEALAGLKQQIDDGNFPAQDPAAYQKWLSGHSDYISKGQDMAWTDRTPEELNRYSVANDPDSRALLTEYITTRRESAWDAFRAQALKTPNRRAIEADRADFLETSPSAKWMNDTFGDGAAEHLLSAGDPVQLATLILPMARALRGAAAVEKAAAAAGTANTLARRALGAGIGSAKGIPELALFGAEGTLKENPNATAGQVVQGMEDTVLGGLAIGAGTFGLREGAARGLQMWHQRSPEAALAHFLNQGDAGVLVEKPASFEPWTAPEEAPPPAPGKQPKPKQEKAPKETPPVEPGPSGRAVSSIDEDLDALDAATDLTDLERSARRAQLVEERAAAARRSAPSTMLEYAGFGLDEVKALHEAQDAGSVTMPESVRTLSEQFALMMRGRKPGVFIDGVQPEQLPRVFQPRDNIQALPTPEGTLLFDSAQIPPDQAQAAMAGGKIGRLLGYGIDEKPPAGDRVVTLRTSDGHEIASVVVDDATEQTVHDSLAAMGEAEHGDFVEIEPVDIALARRDQMRRAEVENIADALQAEAEAAAFAEKQRAAQKRSATSAKGAGIPDHPDGRRDIVDDIASEGGIYLPPPDQRRGKGEHDEMARLAQELPPRYRAIFKANSSIEADAMAQMLHERYPSEVTAPHPDNLAEAIRSAIRDRMSARGKRAEYLKRERQSLTVEERQHVRFEGEVIDPPSWDKANRKQVTGEQLTVGDEMSIHGELMQVSHIDPDTGFATVEDGERYGVKTLAPDQRFYVETHSPASDRVNEREGGLELKSPEEVREIGKQRDIEDGRARYDKALAANNHHDGGMALTALAVAERGVGEHARRMQQEQMDAVAAAVRDGRPVNAQALDRWAAEPASYAPDASGNIPRRGIPDGYRKSGDRYIHDSARNSGGDPFNTAGHRLPPGPANPLAANAAPVEPIALREIRTFLLDRVGLPAVGVGRFNPRRALGVYKHKPEVIRMRAIEDLPTLAHEIGHHLHRLLDPQLYDGTGHLFGGRFDGELLPVGAPTSPKGYTHTQKIMEGVAEFTRHWLTDPANARAIAPNFAAHFEAALSKADPRLWQGLQEGQRMIERYIAQPAWQKLSSQVVFEVPRQRRTVGEYLRGAYSLWVNTLQPIEAAMSEAARRDPTMAAKAGKVIGWAENHRGGWQSRAHGDVFFRQTDLVGKDIGQGLQGILSKLAPEHVKDFSVYIAVVRAAELEGKGLKSGFDFDGATGFQFDVQRWAPIFEPIRQELLAFQDASVGLLAQSGLISSKQLAAMKTANRNYVPFYRLYETAHGTSIGLRGQGGGFVDVATGIYKMKGSSRAIVDPLQSIVKNAYFFRKLAEQNYIGLQFFDTLRQVQGHGKWADEIAVRVAPTRVDHDTVVAHLKKSGIISGPKDPLIANKDLALTFWRAVQKPDRKNGEVFLARAGVTERWQVRDPMLLRALRDADSEQIGVARVLGPTVAKIVTKPTQLLRWGATGHPVFAAVNWTRDQMSAAVYSQTGFIPFWDGVRGAIHVLSKDQTYQRWVSSGGRFSGQVTTDQGFARTLQDALPKGPAARRLMAGLLSRHKIKEALGMASQILEEATRVQEFARARAKGLSEVDAANLSKEVTLNFARAGQVSRFVNQLVAFFNAGVQDMDKFVRAHANPKTRGSTIMKGLMYITAPSVTAWYLGKDDPAIQSLPEWRKNFFWNVSLHGVAKALGRTGFVLSIPKPFLLGAVYGTTVERALDAATGRDPNGMRKAGANIVSNTVFHGDLIGGFSALQPMLEAMVNYDMFTQRPVVSEQLSSMPKPMQFDTRTSDVARKIGRFTGQSPVVIDHLIGGYFASAGKLGVGAIDSIMATFGMGESATPPARDIFEWPVLRSFASSPYQRSVDVDRFYTAAREVDGLLDAWKRQAPALTSDEKAAWWKQNGKMIEWYQAVGEESTRRSRHGDIMAAQRALAEITKATRQVQLDRQMSAEEKRAKLITLTDQMNASAAAALKLFHPDTKKAVW